MKTLLKISLFMAIAVSLTLGCSKDSSSEDSPKSGNIKFEDAVAKARLVQKYDLNSDGELSYNEAAAVTSVSIEISDIKYLDELKYFVGATDIIFSNRGYNLERFSIPKNARYVSNTFDYGVSFIYKKDYPNLKKITIYSTSISETSICYIYGSTASAEPEEYSSIHLVYVPKEAYDLYKDYLLNRRSTIGPRGDELKEDMKSRFKSF